MVAALGCTQQGSCICPMLISSSLLHLPKVFFVLSALPASWQLCFIRGSVLVQRLFETDRHDILPLSLPCPPFPHACLGTTSYSRFGLVCFFEYPLSFAPVVPRVFCISRRRSRPSLYFYHGGPPICTLVSLLFFRRLHFDMSQTPISPRQEPEWDEHDMVGATPRLRTNSSLADRCG
jgi:hypothetical protein